MELMHEYIRNNKYYKTPKEFREAIDEFFSITIPRITEKFNSMINSNFQIIKTHLDMEWVYMEILNI